MADSFTTEEVVAHDFVSVMLISAMTKMDEDKNCAYDIAHSADKKSVEVELRIDGHEVSMRDFLGKLERAFDDAVANEALKLVSERCGELIDRMNNFQEGLDREIREKFPEIRSEDDY